MPEMKDSGIEWISGIPAEWNSKPIRYLFRHVTEKNIFGNEKTALKFTYGTIIPKSDFDADTDDYVANTILNYTLVRPGVIMINCLNLNYDFVSQRIGLVKDKGAITSAYLAIEPKEDVDSEYANYQLKYFDSIKAFHNMGTGVRKTLDFSELGKKYFILPSKTVQRKIVAYLNGKCAEIDSLHADIEKQIDVLEQYKKSVITEAVTKGLDPNVEMKDSGIEWAIKIPNTWQVIRIKFLMTEKKIKTLNGNEERALSVTQDKGIIFSVDAKVANPSSSYDDYIEVKIGDLIFNKYKAHSGVFFVTPYDGIVTFNYSVYRCNSQAVSKYCEYLFKTAGCISEFNKSLHGVGESISPLYTKDFFNITVVIPPYDEQQKIVNYLNVKCAEIDSAIADKKKQLEILESYKKSLIYEYVTGKKEV